MRKYRNTIAKLILSTVLDKIFMAKKDNDTISYACLLM